MNTMNKIGLRYSPKPRAAYVRTVNGLPIGPGAHPALEDLGAWNIYWLSYPNLERHTDINPELEPIFTLIDPVAGAALETAGCAVGEAKVGDLAQSLPPDKLIAVLRGSAINHLPLAKLFQPGIWLDVMQARAQIFNASRALAGLPVQLDGTTGGNSSNILPLLGLIKGTLH